MNLSWLRTAPRVERADPVAPVPLHVHILDLDRTEITITEAGGIHARCSMAGCRESFYIHPNIAKLYVEQPAHARRA